MTSLYRCIRKGTQVFKFAWSSFHIRLKSVSPHLFGLYGENIGPPGLGSRDRAASSHSLNENIY